MVAKKLLLLRLYYRPLSGVVVLVDCSPCHFMCMCPILVLIYFYSCILINPSVRPRHVLRKPCLINLRRRVFVGIKISTWKYFENSALVVWSRILFTICFYCCVSIGTSHIPVCLFLVPLNIICPLFCTVIICCSSLTVHPLSHSTPYNMSGTVIVVGKIWIRLASLVSNYSRSVATCESSMVMLYVSLSVIFFILWPEPLLV